MNGIYFTIYKELNDYIIKLMKNTNIQSRMNYRRAGIFCYPYWLMFTILPFLNFASFAQCKGVSQPTANLTVIDRPCGKTATGSIKLEIKGGLPPYDLVWTIDNVSSNALPIRSETNQLVLEGLQSGINPGYEVSIKDACGNSFICDSIQLLNSPAISFVGKPTVIKQISNKGEQNGSIAVELTGGYAPRSLVATDVNGKSFVQQFPVGPPDHGKFKYVLEKLPEGLYQIELKSGSKRCTQIWKEKVELKAP